MIINSTGLQFVDSYDNNGDGSLYDDDNVANADHDSKDDDKGRASKSAVVSSMSNRCNELDIGLLGLDKVLFYEKVGVWKASGVNCRW